MSIWHVCLQGRGRGGGQEEESIHLSIQISDMDLRTWFPRCCVEYMGSDGGHALGGGGGTEGLLQLEA